MECREGPVKTDASPPVYPFYVPDVYAREKSRPFKAGVCYGIGNYMHS